MEATRSKEKDWWDNLSEDDFQEAFRMSKRTLIDLQAEIDYHEGVNIDRVDPILLASIWLLGNRRPFKQAEELFKVKDTESVIKSYLLKIMKLGEMYILWPSVNESQLIERGFATEYGFPGIIGVIGSLHVEVDPADVPHSEVYYNKAMEKNTILLQVVCDNNLLLRDVCAGCPGGKSIRETLENSPLYSVLSQKDSPFLKYNQCLLGGTEHEPTQNVLTPYTSLMGRRLTRRQGKFNLLHSSAMCAVERTFRCLENRFPRLTSVEVLKPEFAALILSSVAVLHNFTRVRNDSCDLYI